MVKAILGLVAHNWLQNLVTQQVFNEFLLVPVTVLSSDVEKKDKINKLYSMLDGRKCYGEEPDKVNVGDVEREKKSCNFK